MKHAHRPTSRTHAQRINFREIPRPERLNELLGVQPATTPHDEERARRRAEFAAENKRLAEAARQRMERERHAALTKESQLAQGMNQEPNTRHEFDDDACCIHCGFDGAEWAWLKRQGCVSEDQRPLCERGPSRAEVVRSQERNNAAALHPQGADQ